MGLYAALADVLEYPAPRLEERVDECLRLLDRAAAGRDELQRFAATVTSLTCGELQEAYTAAFDLEADATLYVGHHLFGEDRRRVLFMSRLAGLYVEAGFRVEGGEAPDHLGAILRYVDGPSGAASRADLLADAITPAAERAAEALERRGHPYAPLLRAVAAVARSAPAGAAVGEATV